MVRRLLPLASAHEPQNRSANAKRIFRATGANLTLLFGIFIAKLTVERF